jgi:hypothetical protein
MSMGNSGLTLPRFFSLLLFGTTCERCAILYHWLHRTAVSADPDLQHAVAEIGHDVAGVRGAGATSPRADAACPTMTPQERTCPIG